MKEIKKPSPVKDALRDAAEIIAGLVMFGILLAAFLWTVKSCAREVVNVASKIAEEEREVREECGEEAALSAETYLSGSLCRAEKCAGFEAFSEDSGEPAPEWYRPEEEMAVEWTEEPKKDIGCSDPYYDSLIWGWDGHSMAKWEMDLLSRIVYLEFNGVEPECMNAGIDSILNLWDSGYFGRTLFDTLSATAENGALVYTTYGYVWDWDYDYTVLEEIKAICFERFINGPQYGCHFFQLYGFPWWAEPLYEIDFVYFSTFKEGAR